MNSQPGWVYEGSAVLHERLAGVDPVTAGRLHPNDARRIIRALAPRDHGLRVDIGRVDTLLLDIVLVTPALLEANGHRPRERGGRDDRQDVDVRVPGRETVGAERGSDHATVTDTRFDAMASP